MASGSEYSLPYASLIIQEYEKASIEAAVDTRSRDLCAIPWLKSLAAYNMLLDSAEKVLSEDIPGMQKKAKKAQGKNPGWASRAQAASPQAEKSDSSSAPEDSSPCSFSPIWEQDKAFRAYLRCLLKARVLSLRTWRTRPTAQLMKLLPPGSAFRIPPGTVLNPI